MRLEALEVYISIVDTASLSAASRREHLTQSSVSTILSALERELGCKLIERSQGQRTTLTPTTEGRMLYTFAQEVVRLKRRMLLDISGADRDDAKVLAIITGPTISANVLPVLMSEFARSYPDIPVSIQTLSSDATRMRIRDDDNYDLAITTTHTESQDLFYERFFRDPVVLVCNREIDVEDTITLAQLKKLPLVTREDGSAIMQNLLRNLSRHHIEIGDLNVALQVYGNYAVIEAVQNGPLCGFTALSSAMGPEQDRRYRIVRISDYQHERYIYLVRRKRIKPTPAVTAFWQFALGADWRGGFPFDTRCGA